VVRGAADRAADQAVVQVAVEELDACAEDAAVRRRFSSA